MRSLWKVVSIAFVTCALVGSPCIGGSNESGSEDLELSCEQWKHQWENGHTTSPIPEHCTIVDNGDPFPATRGSESGSTTTSASSSLFGFFETVLDGFLAMLASL